MRKINFNLYFCYVIFEEFPYSSPKTAFFNYFTFSQPPIAFPITANLFLPNDLNFNNLYQVAFSKNKGTGNK